MQVYLVYGRKSNSPADGVAYDCQEAALLSMKRQGMSEEVYKTVEFNLATLALVQRWVDHDEV